jgi:hypothetical protein
MRASDRDRKSAAILGLAFDNDDGHTRLSRGKNFLLCGGSGDTHAVMQETALKVNERLDQRGKRLEDVDMNELSDIFRDVSESTGASDSSDSSDSSDGNA